MKRQFARQETETLVHVWVKITPPPPPPPEGEIFREIGLTEEDLKNMQEEEEEDGS